MLVWGSWCYVLAALAVANYAYQKLRIARPEYFGSDSSALDLFSFRKASRIMEMVSEDNLARLQLPPRLKLIVQAAQIAYLASPIALITFFVGLLLR
jgi:hypothetical protein